MEQVDIAKKPAAWRSSLLIFLGATGATALACAAAALSGMALLLLSPLLLLVLAYAVRDYRLCTLLAVLVLPLSSGYLLPRQLFGISGLHPMNLLLLLLLLSICLFHALRPGQLRVPAWPLCFLAYLAVFGIAAMQGVHHTASIPAYFKEFEIIRSNSASEYLLNSFLKPCITLVTAFILSIAILNARRPALYLVPLFGAALWYAGAIFYYAATSSLPLAELGSSHSRAYLSVIGLHSNELGLLLNMAFALALAGALHAARRADKLLLALVAATVLAAIVLTFSRGAYLGSLTVIAYLLYVKKKYGLLLCVLLLLPFGTMLMPEPVAQRATYGIQDSDMGTISSGRVNDIWLPLLPELAHHPLLGNGLASILWSDAAQHRTILPVGHPHSAYLGLVMDAGLLGVIVVLLFFVHMWRLFSALARAGPTPLWRGFFRGAAACVLLLLVQGVTDDSFLPSRTQVFLWIAYAMAIGLAARQRAAERLPEATAQKEPERVQGQGHGQVQG